jgi:hypothetical protein
MRSRADDYGIKKMPYARRSPCGSKREQARAQILAGVDAAETSVARGMGQSITHESMRRYEVATLGMEPAAYPFAPVAEQHRKAQLVSLKDDINFPLPWRPMAE